MTGYMQVTMKLKANLLRNIKALILIQAIKCMYLSDSVMNVSVKIKQTISE